MPVEVKGDKIGTVTQTLGLAESKSHNVSTTINANDYEVDNRDVFVELYKHGGSGTDELITTFAATGTSQSTVNIPSEEVEQSDILVPGRTVKAALFERKENTQNTQETQSYIGSSQRIGTATVVQDTSSTDGCDSRLTSRAVYRYLSTREKPIKFTNERTGDSEIGLSQRLEKGNAFSFPADIRDSISATPGDKIVIEVPNKNDSANITEAEKDSERMIAEMHGAIMEMYNAYIQSTND